MACTSLIAAKSATKGKLQLQRGTREPHWWRTGEPTTTGGKDRSRQQYQRKSNWWATWCKSSWKQDKTWPRSSWIAPTRLANCRRQSACKRHKTKHPTSWHSKHIGSLSPQERARTTSKAIQWNSLSQLAWTKGTSSRLSLSRQLQLERNTASHSAGAARGDDGATSGSNAPNKCPSWPLRAECVGDADLICPPLRRESRRVSWSSSSRQDSEGEEGRKTGEVGERDRVEVLRE